MVNEAQRIRWREKVEKSRRAVYLAVLRGHERKVAIIKASGISERTVDRRLPELVAKGLVRVTPRGRFVPVIRELLDDLIRLGRVKDDELGNLGQGYYQDLRRVELLLKPRFKEEVGAFLGNTYFLRAFDRDPWEFDRDPEIS